ncbi:MAG: PAS domain S-box protein [Hyphomicrobiaceae bacterium]|nr:PAS domain S-box protein [Hyphomicrobiaceae bacterium]
MNHTTPRRVGMAPQSEVVDPNLENKLCSLLIARVKDYAIFMLNADGQVMTWNEGARLIKGYTRDEIIGQPMSRFYTPEDQQRGRPAELLREAVKHGRVEDEGWRVRKDGSRFWADVVITAVRDEKGELLGFAKITRDLTERRKAEAAIGELSARLFRLQDEERQQLASHLHDRTSGYLTAVLGSLYRVKAHLKSKDVVLLNDVSESISQVEAASDVIRRVAHMLHPSRLEQGGLVETLRWYVNAVSGQRLKVSAELPQRSITISKEAEIVLFRFVQECLNYLIGRPGAREAIVRLSTEGKIQLQIAVHGPLPFGLLDALSAGPSESNGLTGVRERLRQLGGKLDVMAGENKSVVEASVPAR